MRESRLQAVASGGIAAIYRLKPGLQRLVTEFEETLLDEPSETSQGEGRMIAKLAMCAAVVFMADTTAEKREDGQIKLLPIERNIIHYTNAERKRYGLAPLEVDAELLGSARKHCAWMTRRHSLQHARRGVAENIAMGQPTSKDVVRAWMNSSGHRANILNRNHRRIGVAAYRTEKGTIYWCQQFKR